MRSAEILLAALLLSGNSAGFGMPEAVDDDYDKAVIYCAMAVLRQEIVKIEAMSPEQHGKLYDDSYRRCRSAIGALMEH